MWRYFAHYWTTHAGSCSHALAVLGKTDCLHWCGYNPVQWAPVWADLASIVSEHVELTDDEERMQRNEHQTMHKTFYMRDNETVVLRVAVDASSTEPAIVSDLIEGNRADYVYFLREYGVTHWIEGGRADLRLLFQRNVSDAEIIDMSAEEISTHPRAFEFKPLMKDDTVLRHSGDIKQQNTYVMKDGMRRFISQIELKTFMQKRKMENWDVRDVPAIILNMIPERKIE